MVSFMTQRPSPKLSRLLTIFTFLSNLFTSTHIIPIVLLGTTGIVCAQDTTLATSTVTETFVEIRIVISTVTQELTSCPCPSSTLEILADLPTTVAFLGAPLESAAVIQLYFMVPAQDSLAKRNEIERAEGNPDSNENLAHTRRDGKVVSYFMSRADEQIVIDTVPLALYVGSDGIISQASDISQRVYFSLPPSFTDDKPGNGFKDLLPLLIGDLSDGTVSNGFFEAVDGNVYFNTTKYGRTYTLGFTICPDDESEVAGQYIYMYDTALESPVVSECLVGSAKKRAYSEFATGPIIGFPFLSAAGGISSAS